MFEVVESLASVSPAARKYIPAGMRRRREHRGVQRRAADISSLVGIVAERRRRLWSSCLSIGAWRACVPVALVTAAASKGRRREGHFTAILTAAHRGGSDSREGPPNQLMYSSFCCRVAMAML